MLYEFEPLLFTFIDIQMFHLVWGLLPILSTVWMKNPYYVLKENSKKNNEYDNVGLLKSIRNVIIFPHHILLKTLLGILIGGIIVYICGHTPRLVMLSCILVLYGEYKWSDHMGPIHEWMSTFILLTGVIYSMIFY